jgi:hypothetical protein
VEFSCDIGRRHDYYKGLLPWHDFSGGVAPLLPEPVDAGLDILWSVCPWNIGVVRLSHASTIDKLKKLGRYPRGSCGTPVAEMPIIRPSF